MVAIWQCAQTEQSTIAVAHASGSASCGGAFTGVGCAATPHTILCPLLHKRDNFKNETRNYKKMKPTNLFSGNLCCSTTPGSSPCTQAGPVPRACSSCSSVPHQRTQFLPCASEPADTKACGPPAWWVPMRGWMKRVMMQRKETSLQHHHHDKYHASRW